MVCFQISVCATSRCSLEVDSLFSSFCFVAQKDLLLASGHSWTWSSVDAFKSNMCCIEKMHRQDTVSDTEVKMMSLHTFFGQRSITHREKLYWCKCLVLRGSPLRANVVLERGSVTDVGSSQKLVIATWFTSFHLFTKKTLPY